MKKNILIIFAQRNEASAAINRFRAEPVCENRKHDWQKLSLPFVFRFTTSSYLVEIVLTGIGLHAAQMAVSFYSSQFDEVWNFGFAGSFLSEESFAKIYSIKTIGKYIPLTGLDSRTKRITLSSLPDIQIADSGKTLISSDIPIHTHEHHSAIKSSWDLVDMEGYGIAYACRYLGKKCKMWKIVSDFAMEKGHQLIKKYEKHLAEQIAEHIEIQLTG